MRIAGVTAHLFVINLHLSGGESGLWILNGDIENLSCLVEQGISDSDRSRIPRHSVA
ncbi:hypothetical protein MICAC_7280001 [Microcystis aeruginosa PCC 9443]|uniref:Uncharacterized protein n=1 Tax=Microcystis aeruginosa PCC 9443 TaxID=1160281 RepID=I4GB63_MICAE|nr:hypothetical protein MICAC_7280001 [Microcystis aeruginosa PCC 9443]